MMPASGSYAMPYVYEDFDWEHCAELGILFASVDEGTYLGDVSGHAATLSYSYAQAL